MHCILHPINVDNASGKVLIAMLFLLYRSVDESLFGPVCLDLFYVGVNNVGRYNDYKPTSSSNIKEEKLLPV